MNEQIFEYKDIETIEKDSKSSYLVTKKTEMVAVSNKETTSYKVLIRDTFKHKKGEEITPQIILHSIQTLVDETKNYLIKHNIKDVSPIVYLLNIHQTKKIKDICSKIDIEENLLISAFLKNSFETNFGSLLKDVLINLCLLNKVHYEKILSFLDKDDQKNLKTMLSIK